MNVPFFGEVVQFQIAVGLIGGVLGFWIGHQFERRTGVQNVGGMLSVVTAIIFAWAATWIVTLTVVTAAILVIWRSRDSLTPIVQRFFGPLLRRLQPRRPSFGDEVTTVTSDADDRCEHIRSLPLRDEEKERLIALVEEKRRRHLQDLSFRANEDDEV